MDIHDVIADIKAGRVTEAFGTGTAAVVSPVNKIRFQGEEIGIGDGGIGHITQQLYDVLTASSSARRKIPWLGCPSEINHTPEQRGKGVAACSEK